MPSQAAVVELFNKLEADSGTRQAVISEWSVCVETNREDGNDSLQLTFPLSNPIAASVANGWAPRIVGEDGTIREYLVYIIEDDLNADTCALTCYGARSRLGYADCPMADGSYGPGSASTLAGSISLPGGLSVGVGTWPATTIGPITASGDTVLSYLVKLVAAIDATLSSGTPPCVMTFPPTISSGVVTGYVIGATTTVATGTAHLLQGKNIAKFTRRRDSTDPTFPLTGFVMLVLDLFRDRPDLFPNDNLLPFQDCRLEWPSLSIDLRIRIVSVTTDHKNSLGTTLELGTPLKRLPQTVATVTTGVGSIPDLPNTPSPTLTVTPGTQTTAEQPYTITAENPQNSADHGVTTCIVHGTTWTGSTVGAIAADVLTTITNGEVVTVDRPAYDALPPRATFVCTLSGGGVATDAVDISPRVIVPAVFVLTSIVLSAGPVATISFTATGQVDLYYEGTTHANISSGFALTLDPPNFSCQITITSDTQIIATPPLTTYP